MLAAGSSYPAGRWRVPMLAVSRLIGTSARWQTMAFLYKPTYTKVDPTTGKKVKKKAAKWYFSYRDADGIVRRVPGDKSKDITRQMAVKYTQDASLKKAGIVDPFAAHRQHPLTKHLADFT
jgi:hypothetical protein